MDLITVRTCKLDPLGIPDLGDLQERTIDLSRVAISTRMAIEATDPERLSYYPMAVVAVAGELLFVPLDRETRLDAAVNSTDLLRNALDTTDGQPVDNLKPFGRNHLASVDG